MVMKDKLVKTNHKGPYYVMKRLSIAFLVLASATFAIAVPTYIYQSNKTKKTMIHAEEESSIIIENSEGEESSYESYND